MDNSDAIDPGDLCTMESLAAEHPHVLTLHALRHQVRHRASNGLAQACVRLGRRVLISRTRYAQWLGTRAGGVIA